MKTSHSYLASWGLGIPPTPAKELSAAYTTPMLAMKLNVLATDGRWNGFMLIAINETHPAWPPPTWYKYDLTV